MIRRLLARKRRVRLHFLDDAPTLEGFLVGRYGGHYVVELPKLLEQKGRTVALSGHIEVPAERVFFVQVNP
jgi:hypothetical protein